MNERKLSQFFKHFDNLKVLIIGDVMVDSYMWGRVSRISPEAPVPVVAIERKESRLGGAANVALNIQALGATPILCSVIGNDEKGNLFLELMRAQKLPNKGILKSRERITTVKTRVISSNHQMLRVDEEVEETISEHETKQFLTLISYLLKKERINVVIFEDYDKGLITPDLINKVVTEARRKKIPVVVDPKKKNFNSYKNVTLFKPNLKELKEGLKVEFDHSDPGDLSRAVNILKHKLKLDIAMITLSELGIYVSGNGTDKIIPAHVRNIADVSGAGDTVISTAALCLAAGMTPTAMASIANLAGGLVCEKVGVVPVDKELLLTESKKLARKGKFKD
ncbi:MAG: D-glycero-beta-D-manno-heptose-7-phosphate kinase [Bacteroidia bacterium]|nr:D-glycero-beta-D-manno-heptose-7-phosphate kinase [Bacteroidia bacterium]